METPRHPKTQTNPNKHQAFPQRELDTDMRRSTGALLRKTIFTHFALPPRSAATYDTITDLHLGREILITTDDVSGHLKHIKTKLPASTAIPITSSNYFSLNDPSHHRHSQCCFPLKSFSRTMENGKHNPNTQTRQQQKSSRRLPTNTPPKYPEQDS